MSGWNHEQVLRLIKEVRKRPSLYETKHPLYKSRATRLQMLNECKDALQSIRSQTTIDEVKKKWSAIRQTYMLEKRKEENSMKSGVGMEMVHTSSLFYYKEMEFLQDSVEARASDSINNPEEDTDSYTISDPLLSIFSSLRSFYSMEPEDSEDRYVKTVADRLRSFSERERVLIKKKIDDILFKAYAEKEGILIP